MRLLIALAMTLAVFVSLPTLAAANIDAPMEQSADSPDVTNAIDIEPIFVLPKEIAVALLVRSVPFPEATFVRTGPYVLSTWRVVTRIESAPIRNYESGLALNRD